MSGILEQAIYQAPTLNEALKTEYQNRWVVVNQNNHILTDPELLKNLQLKTHFGYLVIQAEGMLRLDIPLDVIEDEEDAFETVYLDDKAYQAIDEGELSQAWFSQHLNQVARLMKLHPQEQLNIK